MALDKAIGELSIQQAKDFLNRGTYLDNEILLIDNLDEHSFPSDQRVLRCLLILLNTEGSMSFESDKQTIKTDKNDVIILTQSQSVSNHKITSSTYHGKAILIASDNIAQLASGYDTFANMAEKIINTHKVSLLRQDIENFNFCFERIKGLLHSQSDKNLKLSLTLTKFLLQSFLAKKGKTNHLSATDHNLNILQHFIELIDQNIHKNLPISQYCRMLNISNSRLGYIVEKYMNMTPSKVLRLKTVNSICVILGSTSLNCKDIAERVHFETRSSMTRFFKREMSITPSYFRSLTHDQQQDIIRHTIPYQISP